MHSYGSQGVFLSASDYCRMQGLNLLLTNPRPHYGSSVIYWFGVVCAAIPVSGTADPIELHVKSNIRVIK